MDIDITDSQSSSSSSSSDDDSSSSESSVSQASTRSVSRSSSVSPKIIYRRNRKYDVTYLPNKYKKRKNPGIAETAHWPRRGKKVTPDKLSKFRIIGKLHRYWARSPNPSLKRFQRKYRNRHSGHCSYISRLSLPALRRYQANFKEGSEDYEKLKKYCFETRHTVCKNKKRFYVDPDSTTYGLLPIFEEYLVSYRKVVATEYEWRSVDWFTSEGQRILKNVKLMGLLRPFMGADEKQFIEKLKCQRAYINKIVVFNNIYILVTNIYIYIY